MKRRHSCEYGTNTIREVVALCHVRLEGYVTAMVNGGERWTTLITKQLVNWSHK